MSVDNFDRILPSRDAAVLAAVHTISAQPRVRIADIQSVVAVQFGVRMDILLSKQRYRRIARPRQAAMYLARELTPSSLTAIGKRFNRDHTTVVHAIRKVKWLLERDIEFAINVEQIRKRIAVAE